MSVRDYPGISTELTVASPSGLPGNVAHAINVLKSLGVCDDAMFLAVLDDCIAVDKLHLCRMVQRGLLNGLEGSLPDRIAFSGTDLHIPFDIPGISGAELPPIEIVVSLTSSSINALFFQKDVAHYTPVSPVPLYAEQVLVAVQRGAADLSGDTEQALQEVFKKLRDVAKHCYTAQRTVLPDESLFDAVSARL